MVGVNFIAVIEIFKVKSLTTGGKELHRIPAVKYFLKNLLTLYDIYRNTQPVTGVQING